MRSGCHEPVVLVGGDSPAQPPAAAVHPPRISMSSYSKIRLLLAKCDCSEFLSEFERNEVDDSVLALLNEERLIQILPNASLGKRLKVLQEIERMLQRSSGYSSDGVSRPMVPPLSLHSSSPASSTDSTSKTLSNQSHSIPNAYGATGATSASTSPGIDAPMPFWRLPLHYGCVLPARLFWRLCILIGTVIIYAFRAILHVIVDFWVFGIVILTFMPFTVWFAAEFAGDLLVFSVAQHMFDIFLPWSLVICVFVCSLVCVATMSNAIYTYYVRRRHSWLLGTPTKNTPTLFGDDLSKESKEKRD